MTTNVTPVVAIIVIVVIIIVAALIAFLTDPRDYKHSRSFIFLAALAGLAIFVIFLFYYSVIELQQEQLKLFSLQETSRVSNTLLDSMFNEIQAASVRLPTFTSTLLPLLNSVENPEPDQITFTTQVEKYNLSYHIFTTFQDVLLTENFIAIEDLAYTTNFLQRANSKPLFEQWKINKIDFNQKTQQFGDLLFEYGLPITEQTPAKYTETAQKLLQDPRYQALVNI